MQYELAICHTFRYARSEPEGQGQNTYPSERVPTARQPTGQRSEGTASSPQAHNQPTQEEQ